MTWGELAGMINGEGWLTAGKNACDLTEDRVDPQPLTEYQGYAGGVSVRLHLLF